MKSMKVLLFLTMLLIMSLAFTFSEGESLTTNALEGSHHEYNSLRGTDRRYLTEFPQPPAVTTCATNPSICLDEGSAGRDCCSNNCVKMTTDSSNCGKCGKECGRKKTCCEGKCVNSMTNKNHCGNCGNKCGKGSSCVRGTCSDK